jgi:hypothetical protein
MLSNATITECFWVGGGFAVTVVIGLAVLYWMSQEWRAHHRQRSQAHVPPSTGQEPQEPPAQSAPSGRKDINSPTPTEDPPPPHAGPQS